MLFEAGPRRECLKERVEREMGKGKGGGEKVTEERGRGGGGGGGGDEKQVTHFVMLHMYTPSGPLAK